MDKEKIRQQREKLLQRANEELKDELIPSVLKDKEESGIEDGELAILFDELGLNDDEAFGAFVFSPVITDDDEVQYFNCVIVLTQDIDREKLPLLYEAFAYINFYIPYGSFAIDGDNESIVYRYTQALPIRMKDEDLYAQIQIAMGNAISMADSNINLVLSLEDGTMDLEDVRDIFISSGDEE